MVFYGLRNEVNSFHLYENRCGQLLLYPERDNMMQGAVTIVIDFFFILCWILQYYFHTFKNNFPEIEFPSSQLDEKTI